jgi:hypothetical protein
MTRRVRGAEVEWRWAEMDEAERAACRRTGIVPADYPDRVAADWPDLLEIVERLVKPDRAADNRDLYRRHWWLFAEKRMGLRRARIGLIELHLLSRISAHHGVTTIPAETVCAETTVVLADDAPNFRGVLQSRPHELWAAFFASSLGGTLRYGPSDCFETFPLPAGSESDDSLAAIATAYHAHRASLMVARNEGLTRTYNRFHSPSDRTPEIQRLRELHHALDLAVLRAYGWGDLAARAAPEFLTGETEPDHRYQGRLFWPAPFRDEVLARLLDLNRARAAEERRLGLSPAAPTEEETEEAEAP